MARPLIFLSGYVGAHRADLVKIAIIAGTALVCAVIYDRLHNSAERQDQAEIKHVPLTDREKRPPLLFSEDDFIAPVSLLTKLKTGKDPLTKYIISRQNSSLRPLLDSYTPSTYPSRALLDALIREFNVLLFDPSLYEPDRFTQIKLSEDTKSALNARASGDEDLPRLNHLLLEDAYPYEILNERGVKAPEVEGAVAVPELLDEFKRSPEAARTKYFGKRFLIRGVIGEVVVHDHDAAFGAGSYYNQTPSKDAVMLVSVDNLPYPNIPLPYARDRISVGVPGADARIQFEGIYCVFLYRFSPRVLGGDLISRKKTHLLTSCEIVGFEKGVTRAPEPAYRSRFDREDSSDKYQGHEKDRVIAVNCREMNYVLAPFP